MKPTKKENLKATFHKDSTVSLWDVETKTWERFPKNKIPKRIFQTLDFETRKKLS